MIPTLTSVFYRDTSKLGMKGVVFYSFRLKLLLL